jgi:NAD(P)-dependent dehydrogenase (short-subunit alcohol dehydrogenase family)
LRLKDIFQELDEFNAQRNHEDQSTICAVDHVSPQEPNARIVNVSSGVGSLTANSEHAFPYRAIFGPVYPASKTALNALTVAMAIELEPEGIKVNAVSPGFARTNLNDYRGTQTVEEGAREVVRVALMGPDGPTGTFTRWENETIPW